MFEDGRNATRIHLHRHRKNLRTIVLGIYRSRSRVLENGEFSVP